MSGADTQQIGVDPSHERALPPRWSPSALTTFCTCPLAYWWKYAGGWATLPTVATAAGSIAHSILERVLAAPAAERTVDTARAVYREEYLSWQDTGHGLDEEEVAAVVGRVGVAMRQYFALEDPATVEPIIDGLEREVDGEIEGVSIGGRIDRAEEGIGGLRIVDYKTGSAKPRYAASYWRQQYLYADLLAQADLDVTEVELLYLGEVARRMRRPLVPAAQARFRHDLVEAAAQRDRSSSEAAWEARPGPLCTFCPFARACPAMRNKTPQPGSEDSDRLLTTVRRIRRRQAPIADVDVVGDPEDTA
jgi:putative RecB family exonuclease